MNSTPERSTEDREDALPRAVVDRLRRILIIDDDEFVCKVVAAQIRSLCAADVTTTFGDATTVRLLNEGGPFDLIISDLAMPKFDGIQLMRLVAARQTSAALVFISSSSRKLLSVARELAVNRGLRVLPPLEKPLKRSDLYLTLLRFADDAPNARKKRPPVSIPSIAELREALNQFEIEVYVQPQVYASNGQLYGVEALARWNSGTHGFVPPDIFVKMAEQHGMVDTLTDQILKKSLSACSAWKSAGIDTRISVNAPISSMSNLMLPDTVAALIDRFQLRADQLTMEITETGILTDEQRALDVLARMRLRGIGLAIDDFGCGHSTFQQIRRMPFSELKIDCSFVMNMFIDPDSRSIVRSSLDLARELDMHSVAEGVETIEHWDALAEMHCDVLQGYYIAKPFPAVQLPEWLARYKKPGQAASVRTLALSA